MTEKSSHIGLGKYLSKRLFPLTVCIGLLLALSAPLIYWILEHRNLQRHTSLYAVDLADKFRNFVTEDPGLWKYQTYKFMTIAEGFHPTIEVAGFRVLDEKGEPVSGYQHKDVGISHTGKLTFREELSSTRGTAPIMFNNRHVGTVEVLVSDLPLLRASALIFCFSTLIGITLAVLVYRFPVRVVKRMEGELSSATEFARTVMDSMNDAVSIINVSDFRIVGGNAEFLENVGMTEADVVGRRCYELTHHRTEPCCPPNDTCPLMETVKTGRHSTADHIHFPGDDRKIYVEVSTSPVFDGSGRVVQVVHVARDISDRKRAEEALAAQTQELARSNAELEQFAYVASHDLQEPLRMVSSYMQLLARRYRGKLDADADEFIDFAVDGAARMQRLIRDLLMYSRVGTKGKEPVPTDCGAVIGYALANLQEAIAEKGATVSHDELPTVMGDEVQLTQLFQNLIGNAIKFQGEEPPRVHVGVLREGSGWLFSVRDNGIGISPEHFERIFKIFQRLHGREEYPGTGIGLSVCKKIVEWHGGRIWVKSAPGEGTTFLFTIPGREE
jgi:PAS domain S-box-containing protein